MTDQDIEQLVKEAHQRAYEQAMLSVGREPNHFEVVILLIQAQLSMLTSTMLDRDELATFWRNVATVLRGGKTTEHLS